MKARVPLAKAVVLLGVVPAISGCVVGFGTYDDGYLEDGSTGGWWDYGSDNYDNWWSPWRPPSDYREDDDGSPYYPWDGGDDTWQPPNDDPFDDDGGGTNVPLSVGTGGSETSSHRLQQP